MTSGSDSNRWQTPDDPPVGENGPDKLRRSGAVFFIGANLPVYETLETMLESRCEEATELFHLTFGQRRDFERNLAMVRQTKKNFSVRLMGRIDYLPTAAQIEAAYLAGIDMLDLPCLACADTAGIMPKDLLKTARSVFSHWSLLSSFLVDAAPQEATRSTIDNLLQQGVVPLLVYRGRNHGPIPAAVNALYGHLTQQWRAYAVPTTHLRPLLRQTTPLLFEEHDRFLKGVIERLHRHKAVILSDVRRHLRTAGAAASFDSAGL